MPWSGGVFTRTNGTYTGTTVWAQDAAAAVKIVSARHDTHDQDLAQGINACLKKDGTNIATAITVTTLTVTGTFIISSLNITGALNTPWLKYTKTTGAPTFGSGWTIPVVDSSTFSAGQTIFCGDGTYFVLAIIASVGAGSITTGTLLNSNSVASIAIGSALTIAQSYNYALSSSSSGVLNIDCSGGDFINIALFENITSITFSNLPAGGTAVQKKIQIVQNGLSAKTVTWPVSFKWAGGVAGVVSTGLSAVDFLTITTFDKGVSWQADLKKAFA